MEEEDKKDPASNFSSSAKQIISYSREEAIRLGNDFIGTEHLLLGILKHYSNVAVAILAHYTDNLAQIKNDLEFRLLVGISKNFVDVVTKYVDPSTNSTDSGSFFYIVLPEIPNRLTTSRYQF